jgi:hypothetical protein
MIGANIKIKLKQKSSTLICEAYKLIFNAIVDPSNGYANSNSIVPRTPEQVVKLLS